MNKRDTNWENIYFITLNFIKKYNYYPSYHKNNKDDINKIAKWIQFQKEKYDRKELNNYKIEKLQKLPYWKWNNIVSNKEIIYIDDDDDDPIEEFDEPVKAKVYYPKINDPIEEFDEPVKSKVHYPKINDPIEEFEEINKILLIYSNKYYK